MSIKSRIANYIRNWEINALHTDSLENVDALSSARRGLLAFENVEISFVRTLVIFSTNPMGNPDNALTA